MKQTSTVLILALALAFGLFPYRSPAGAADGSEVDDATKTRVLRAIETYVREDQALKTKFLVLDPQSGQPLSLAFDHVHSGVHPHEKGYRACVDFKDEAGTLYDVDVVVAVEDDGDDVVRAVWVHKVAGEPVDASGR